MRFFQAWAHCARALFVTGFAILACAPAQAGQLRIVPTLVDMQGTQQSALVRIENSGGERVTVQLRLFSWSQTDGTDQWEPSDEIITSPPIANIESGTTQSVRLIRRDKSESLKERSYRLLIDELPQSAEVGGVRVLLRYALPVFIGPAKPLAYEPAIWTLHTQPAPTLVARNPGQKRIRVSRLKLQGSSGELQPFGPGLVGYVLAGQVRRWPLPESFQFSDLSMPAHLKAQSEWGPLSATVKLEKQP